MLIKYGKKNFTSLLHVPYKVTFNRKLVIIEVQIESEGGNCEEITSICDAWNFNYGEENHFSVLPKSPTPSALIFLVNWQQSEVVWVIMKSLSTEKFQSYLLRNSQTEIKFTFPLMFFPFLKAKIHSYTEHFHRKKKLLFLLLTANTESLLAFSSNFIYQ